MIFFIIIAGTAFPAQLLAQDNGSVRGTITDSETGENLIGVNLIIEGTNIGTASGLDGGYVLRGIPAGT
ncbi:MAG: carboxypeptidase-like regulatory domain-containing protein, partial [Cyclonatronaceae bacterium]